MNTTINRAFLMCAVLIAGLVTAGCDGLSDVGEQEKDDAPPVADAVVLNQPFEKDASGNVTTRVRSGSEVFLSGNDSDGAVSPVLGFQWELMSSGPAADRVKIVDRNSNTISFTAPGVEG
ncbi:MAG: hypothetical protein ACREV5_11185, partial [Steroidobacter sp.]